MNKLSHKIIYNSVILIGIIISIIVFVISTRIKEDYQLISLLPIVYTLMLMISSTNRKLINNIGILIINIVLFIRYLAYPLLIIFNAEYDLGLSQYIGYSIFLMAYECLAVFITLNWWGKKRLIRKEQNIHQKSTISFKSHLDVILILTLGVFIFTTLLYPSLLFKYGLYENNRLSNKIPGVLYVFFNIGIDILFIMILKGIYKLFKGKSTFIALILSIFLSIIIIQAESNIQTGSVSRWGFLVYGITILLILSRIYKSYSKYIVNLGIPTIGIFIIILTFIKFGNEFSINLFIYKYLSAISLDYYFMGIENVSYGILTANLYENSISIYTLLTDMFSAVPLISGLFDAHLNSTPEFYHQIMNRTDSIIPTVAQSYSYFGFIGAPVFSILFVVLTIELNRRLNSTTDILMFFILAQLTIRFALFMAININIIQEGTWQRLIFVAIVFLNNKFRFLTPQVTHAKIVSNNSSL